MIIKACLIAAIVCFAPTAPGSPLNQAQSQFDFFPTGITGLLDFGGPPSTTKSLSFTNPNNALPAVISGTGDLVAQGLVLGASSSLALTNAPAGQYDVRSLANYSDILTFANAPVGTLAVRFTYRLEGSFDNPDGAFSEQVQVQTGLGGSLNLVEGPASADVHRDFVATAILPITGNSLIDRFSDFVFLQTFISASGQAGSTGLTVSGSADFDTTLRLTNVEVFNAGSGALLPNVTALGSDGVPIFSAATPEPGTQALSLAGLTLLTLAGMRKRGS